MKGLTLSKREQTRLTIMNLILDRKYPVKEAANLMGISERHTWRLLAAYRREGAAALAHKNRGRSPWNSKNPNLLGRVVELARDRYQGVNHCHLTELLAEREGITLSRSTVRRLLLWNGLMSPRHRRGPCHRCRRQRMPQEGMLVQIDGSHHKWLEDRGPSFTLVLAIDDATGSVPFALFQEQEDTVGYFRLVKGIIQHRGIPLALYSDRSLIFRSAITDGNEGGSRSVAKLKATQFGRAMHELGVTQIFAQSPEAKGRIERANGTFQDRLVSELRLSGAKTMAEANTVLEVFIPRFNERFAVPPAQPEVAYRPLDPELDIDTILCIKEYRRVAKDNTVQYHGQTLQFFPGVDRTTYARRRVEVQERLDGQLKVSYRGKVLTPGEAPALAAELRDLGALSLLSPVYDPEELEKPEMPPSQPQIRRMWYEDSELRRLHGEQTKAGLVKARERGKWLGRPKVDEAPGFELRSSSIFKRISSGEITRTQAAKELGITPGTLTRVFAKWIKTPSDPLDPPVLDAFEEIYALAEVID